jgi:hypothetical protein
MLDVAGRALRVKRVAAHRLKRHAGALARELGPPGRRGARVAVLAAARSPYRSAGRDGCYHRKNYAATSPITRASGKKKVVAARFIHNDRLIDALMAWAFSSLNASPGARAFYDELRAKGIEHNDALRRLANRLVGILHGCLKTRTLYDETTAWGHRENLPQSSVAA